MARTEVRIAGFGGQGVVLAGILLGRAVLKTEGQHCVQTQSYGAAARGGAVRSDVIIDSATILYPCITKLDILVAMSEMSAQRYTQSLKTGGVLMVDRDLVKEGRFDGYELYRIPATRIAMDRLGRNIFANLLMIGFLIETTGLLPASDVEEAIREVVPPATLETNLEAFRLGAGLRGS
jgi:2-oxoglutarate ferredoxin oxidoreductase subunit gamma